LHTGGTIPPNFDSRNFSSTSRTTTIAGTIAPDSGSSNRSGDVDDVPRTTNTATSVSHASNLMSSEDVDATIDEKNRLETPIPGAQKGGKKMAIVFTCKVCNTRSAKQFTEQAYKHGVVIVKCPGCSNQHLIADRLGFFEDDSWDIETAMTSVGEKFTAVTNDNVLELTMRDLLGDKVDEALEPVGYDVTYFGDDAIQNHKVQDHKPRQ
jgi:mitochondrial protein import protein ZIM17